MTEFSFDAMKANNSFQNKLTYRGENRRSGVSYDYMDKLNTLVDQGIFYDKDGDGFTKAEKKALEAEFFALHKEKNYSTNFVTMQAGTTHEYTFDDFVRLAQSAGYIMKDATPSQETEEDAPTTAPAQPQNTELKPAPIEVQTPKIELQTTITPLNIGTGEQDEGFEPISQSGKQTVDDIVAALDSGEYQIDFEGTKIIDGETGEVLYEITNGTINGQPFEYTNNGVLATPTTETENAQPEETTPQAEENPSWEQKLAQCSTPEEKAQVLREAKQDITREIHSLSSEKTRRGRVLGMNIGKRIVEQTAEEARTANADKIAALEAQRDEINKQEVILREFEQNEWKGQTALETTFHYDENNTMVRDQGYEVGEKVTLNDGTRILKVKHYNSKTLGYDYTYHTPTVVKTGLLGTPNEHWGLVPGDEIELGDRTEQ